MLFRGSRLLFEKQIVAELTEKLDTVYKTISKFEVAIKNRAMGITVFFSLSKILDQNDR